MTVTPFPQRYPALPRNASFTRYPVPLCIGTGNGNAPQNASLTSQSVTLNLGLRVVQHYNERPIMTQATHLQARAEVIGYPEPVLEAVREVVRIIRADTDFALTFGAATKASSFAVTDGSLLAAIGALLVVTASAALETEART